MSRLPAVLVVFLVACAGEDGLPDAGTGTPDASETVQDGGSVPDAGHQHGDDAGTTVDAGEETVACTVEFAGCTDFVDATAEGADRTVAFSGSAYTPGCLRIKAGQSVTFSGSFGSHPLRQSCGPANVISGATTANATFRFDLPGSYGFHCNFHGASSGANMAGGLDVVP